MAIAFRATPEVGATATRNKPTGTATGDVLLMAVHALHSADAAVTGFTVVHSHNLSGVARVTVLRRTVDGSEGSTFTATGGTILRTAIVGLTGVDTSSPITGTPTNAQGTSGANLVLGAITTGAANSLLVAFVVNGHASNTTGIGTPGTMTEQFEHGTGGATAMVMATQTIAAAGSTGTRTFTHTYSGSNGHCYGVMLAVKEASGTDATVVAPTPNATTAVPTATITATAPNATIVAPTPNATTAVPTATITAVQNTTVVASTPNATASVPTASVTVDTTIAAPTPNATTAVPTAIVTSIQNPTIVAPTPNATAAVPTVTITTVAHITIEAPVPNATASVPTAVVLAVTDVPSWDGGMVIVTPRAPRGIMGVHSGVHGGLTPNGERVQSASHQRGGVRGAITRHQTVTSQQEPIP